MSDPIGMSVSERSLARRVDGFFRPVTPPQRLATLRVLVGSFAFVYLLIRVASMVSLARSAHGFAPVGVVSILTEPVSASLAIGVWIVTTLLAIPFVLGIHYRVVGPLFAALLLWTLSYRSSFGFIFHTENMMVLHAIVLSVSDAAAVWSWDAQRRGGPAPEASARFGSPIKLMCIAASLSYCIAGITKLRVAGSEWATGDILQNQVAFDNLRKAVVDAGFSPVGAWAVRHSEIWRPLALFTFVLELGSPLALFSRKVARVWALGMWGFHLGVLGLMWILFPYALLGFAFFPFFEPEKWIEWVQRRRQTTLRAGRQLHT